MRTVHIPELIEKDRADALFRYLRDNVNWQDGIYSNYKKRVTRKACALSPEEVINDELLFPVVLQVCEYFGKDAIPPVYLNYYRNGKDWTPTHSHTDTNQIVISLGCARTLKVASKSYITKNGDVIFFGSSPHSVPEDESTEARISIAMFIAK